MEENQKHMCKFCYKSFPCGRSLGGHMRSHLINISSSEKKLPPLTNPRTDVLVEDVGKFGYVLRENRKKTRKFSNKSEEDTLLEEKHCKECGKAFQSWKALFGHMKCHSVIGKATNSVEEDSWNSSCDHQKVIMDNQSDNEAATPLCRRKRSERMKRYTTATTNSSSVTVANFSPCVSEIDQQEQEEVALSLILLSMDVGKLGCMNSVVESSSTSSEFLEAKKSAKTSDGDVKLSGGKVKRLKRVSGDEFRLSEEFENKHLEIGSNECEVNSPKTLVNKNGLKLNHFGSDSKQKKSSKKKSKLAYGPCDSSMYQDVENKSKFTCIICKKAFPSYQALGGHRASHKKFKGCCAPTSENTLETENLVGVFEEKIGMGIGWKKNKEHECPICFKVFSSGLALGGHKRSHLIGDESKSIDPSVSTQKRIPEIRDFLDLNLPAPVEEEINDFKPWWIGSSHKHQHEPLLGLLSS